jgi:hypothetical protein
VRKITTSYRFFEVVAGALLIVSSLAGCDPAINSVRVEPGNVPRQPVFVLADSSGRGVSGLIYGISVVPCGADSAVWQIAATGSKGAPARLEYGVTPDGFAVRAGPQPLRPGCYDVIVSNGRPARFLVSSDGRVVPERPPARDSAPPDRGPI